MKLLLDTAVLIDHLRQDARAARLLTEAVDRGDELWASVVTRTELLRGMRAAERADTMLLVDTLSWLDVTVEIADRAGELARAYRSSHPGIDVVDFLIAASADLLPGRLVTRNVRHFPMFPELEPAYR